MNETVLFIYNNLDIIYAPPNGILLFRPAFLFVSVSPDSETILVPQKF